VIWPIYNNETTTGVTIHQITDGIDEGNILYRESFPITFRPTLDETVRATLSETRSRAAKAVSHVCANFFELRTASIRQSNACRYTTPTIWQFLRMRRNNVRLYR
jgi:methionyl-tRNA formyltransferase